MTEFNRTESAKWAIENAKVIGELQSGADKALADAAGRGFHAAPGATLAVILASGQEAKGKLTEGNAKIYEDRRSVLFQEDEFAMKIIVQVAKLAMELYREELLNALVIEQAANTALRDQGRADVDRMIVEVEKRQIAIIRDRAEMERRIIVFKEQLMAAERATMVFEYELINAQLATAQAKLAIIDSIYAVIAAEQAVLAAENSKLAMYGALNAAQMAVAAAKMAMVAIYNEKAAAHTELAAAKKEEADVKNQIASLGYDKVALHAAEAAADHRLRLAELELELSQADYIRASAATAIIREEGRATIQSAVNAVKLAIMDAKKTLEMAGIDLKLLISFEHKILDFENTAAIATDEVAAISAQIASVLSNLTARAASEARRIEASASQFQSTRITKEWHRQIVKEG